jgi:hypothetical protein
VVAHHEQFGITLLQRLSVELQRALIEPSRPGLHVVLEGEPEVRELLDFFIVGPSQIYNVGYPEGSQLLHVGLGPYCASEREPFAHEESFHWRGPALIPNRPRRL